MFCLWYVHVIVIIDRDYGVFALIGVNKYTVVLRSLSEQNGNIYLIDDPK